MQHNFFFPDKADGSIITVNGKKYGSELLGQQYTDDAHMWGRIMNVDVSTYKDKNGKILMYAEPSNLSPSSDKYQKIAKWTHIQLRMHNPDMNEEPFPLI